MSRTSRKMVSRVGAARVGRDTVPPPGSAIPEPFAHPQSSIIATVKPLVVWVTKLCIRGTNKNTYWYLGSRILSFRPSGEQNLWEAGVQLRGRALTQLTEGSCGGGSCPTFLLLELGEHKPSDRTWRGTWGVDFVRAYSSCPHPPWGPAPLPSHW